MKYLTNSYNTTLLTLNIMKVCANRIGLDLNDDKIADNLYWICCDLESWPENEGFGSSDSYSYVKEAKKLFK